MPQGIRAATAHAKAILEIIDAEEARINGLFERHREALLKRITSLLNDPKYRLETQKGTDIIKPTRKNLKKINAIIKQATGKIYPKYLLDGYVDIDASFNQIESLNTAYLTALAPSFRQAPRYEVIKEIAIESVVSNLTRGRLTDILERPIRRTLTEYVRTGGTKAHLADILRRSLESEDQHQRTTTDQDEQAIRRTYNEYHQVKRLTHDALFTYSQEQILATTRDLDIKFFAYPGGEVRDTREFCSDRTGKIWHIEEVKSWASLDWDGKHRDTNETNIFILRGGYNCRHALIPVAEELVSDSDLARMRSKGLI